MVDGLIGELQPRNVLFQKPAWRCRAASGITGQSSRRFKGIKGRTRKKSVCTCVRKGDRENDNVTSERRIGEKNTRKERKKGVEKRGRRRKKRVHTCWSWEQKGEASGKGRALERVSDDDDFCHFLASLELLVGCHRQRAPPFCVSGDQRWSWLVDERWSST